MAKEINKLTDAAIRNARPREKDYSLADGDGLDILITTKATDTGGKYWRFHYRFGGKQDTLRFGVYPAVPLVEARRKKLEAKAKIAAGVNPRAEKKAQRVAESGADSFAAIALEWLEKFAQSRAEGYTKSLAGRLRLHLFPWIGDRPVDGITPQEILEVVRRIEAKGHIETAHRALELAGQVFNYAIQTGRATVNPALPLKGALPPAISKHMAAVTDPAAIGRLLLDIDHYTGSFITLCALKLSPLVFLRPGELRTLKWEQVDFGRAELLLPIEHMKRRQMEKITRHGELAHTVPLARQAIAILEELRPATGDSPFLFPHYRKRQDRSMSNATVLNALRAMGYDKDTMSAHGFRALASTNLNELGYPKDFIEKQLAHKEGDSIRAAYNHAEYLEQRRAMMQDWADWLDARREEARRREAERGGKAE